MLCKLLYITHSLPLCRRCFRLENAQKLLKFVTRSATASQRLLSAWKCFAKLVAAHDGNSIIFRRKNSNFFARFHEHFSSSGEFNRVNFLRWTTSTLTCIQTQFFYVLHIDFETFSNIQSQIEI